jgi:hypothetical protein
MDNTDIPDAMPEPTPAAPPSGPRVPAGLARKLGAVALGVVLIYVVGYVGIWQWGLCRVYVAPGQTLVLNAKFGDDNTNQAEQIVVPEGVKGIRKIVYGEGRYFFNPFTYDRMTDNRVIDVAPGFVGMLESKSGKSLPPGEFLADEGYKGVVRRVITPGRWRLNPVAFVVTPLPATIIEPGFVGCVTSLSGKPSIPGSLAKKGQRGILPDVLSPGIYYINPREFKVEVVEIGYRRIALRNVTFPSKDGFTIRLDISVVWGLEPMNVPPTINAFGNLSDVVAKVISPQVESICRIEGSKYGAKEFIEGKTRERFQTTFTEQLTKVCLDKNITVVIGLVREINVPKEVRIPIQKGKIAMEEKLTKEEQKTTQTVKNELAELMADVRKGVREVEAETEKLVAEVSADGEKVVAEIKAETEVSVAKIMLEVAKLEATKERLLGKAKAEVEEHLEKARADELTQNIEALGTPDDYARYIFTKGLPDDMKIYLRYAGVGTFWTDVPAAAKSMEKLAAMKILEDRKKRR